VHATVDNTPFDLHGILNWIGKPSLGLPAHAWLLLAAGNLPLLVGFGAWQIASRRRRRLAAAAPGRDD
jgi:hypothetical protein